MLLLIPMLLIEQPSGSSPRKVAAQKQPPHQAQATAAVKTMGETMGSSTHMVACAAQPAGPVPHACFASHAKAATTPAVEMITVLVVGWMGSDVSAANAVRFVAHTLLVGASIVVALEHHGRCQDLSTQQSARDARRERDAALATLRDSGLFVQDRHFLCEHLTVESQLLGYRSVVQRMSKKLAPQALIVRIDFDELVVFEGPHLNLEVLRRSMLQARVCTSFLPWRVFGTSGHRCAPSAGLLQGYTRRAPTQAEEEAAGGLTFWPNVTERQDRARQGIFWGKTVFLYGEQLRQEFCGVHTCHMGCRNGSQLTTTWCGPGLEFIGGQPLACSALHQAARLNHYTYQSLEEWERKKRVVWWSLGQVRVDRTNSGSPPPSAELLEDLTAIQWVGAVLQHLGAHQGCKGLSACLEETLLGRVGAANSTYGSAQHGATGVTSAARLPIRALRQCSVRTARPSAQAVHEQQRDAASGLAPSTCIPSLSPRLTEPVAPPAECFGASWSPGCRYELLPGSWVRHDTTDRTVFRTSRLDYMGLLRAISEQAGQPIRTVLDAGANVGFSSALFAQHWKNSTVVALEPHPGNYAMLRLNTGQVCMQACI